MRDLTTDFKTALAAELVRIGLLVEIDYPSTPLRCWTGPTTLSWDSKSWLGVGDLGGISAVRESGAPEASNVTIEISGISSASLALALAETSQRRRASIWLALFSESGGTWSVIADPWRVRRGWTDVHKILKTGRTATIQVSVESILSRLRIARTIRYTEHDQQRLFAGDTGLRYAAGIGEKPIYFGAAPPSGFPAGVGGAGRGEGTTELL